MSEPERARAWPPTRRSFDGLIERARDSRLSFDEASLLRETHWQLGEDALLREDFRFRETPWSRWILSENFLANDAVCTQLHRERRPSLALDATLGALDKVVRRKCVLCSADPRLVVSSGDVRLSARELTCHPLLEPLVGDIERYVTHLPLHGLRAAAASEPAGEWGRRAQEQVIETLGWVKVTLAGRKLNPLMFVAQVEGHSMDDGRSGLVSGGYAVFELWPSGTKQNLNVLVRGAFTDPETGSYAVKKYVGDPRGEDGRHQSVKLVSLNPDRDRFPDIVLRPSDESDVTVVAKVVQALSPSDFARKPRGQARRGRRDLSSPEAFTELAKQLEDHLDRFFEAEPPPKKDEAPRSDTWGASLVCLDGASGGLHLEVGPLRGLWSFVKRLQASGQGWDHNVLASNVRERAIRIPVPPSTGPWTFTAVDFEDDPDIDLSKLDVGGLEADEVRVFRVDAEGIGRAHKSQVVSPGQNYRLLVPSPLPEGPIRSQRLDEGGAGWLLWEIELVRPVPTEVIEALGQLGLTIGEPLPAIEWVVTPPLAFRANGRGESYACFAPNPGPVAELRESHVEVDGEAVVFLRGATETVTYRLPTGQRHLVHLSGLAPGRYVVSVLHSRTAVAPVRAAFEILDAPPPATIAAAELTFGAEVYRARSGALVVAKSRDLGDDEAASAITSLRVSAPPGWPVRVVWREMGDKTLLQRSMDDQGFLEGDELLADARSRLVARRIGDVVLDFAELGRIALPHDRHPHPEAVRARLEALSTGRAPTLEALAGRYLELLPRWFSPICAHLGYDVEWVPQQRLTEPPEHAAALLLFHVERQGERIERQSVRLLVLVERLATELPPEMSAWIDSVCATERLRHVLLSDGPRWATHHRSSRLALHVWDLREVVTDSNGFVPFLRAASEGI